MESGSARQHTIGFDARMVHHSGIGTYIREIVAAMMRLPQAERAVAFRFLGDPELLQRYGFFRRGGEICELQCPIYSLREQLFFPESLPGEVVAYHFPHYNAPLRFRRPFFVTIHDLIHMLFPEVVGSRLKWLVGRSILQRAARRALAIFTVSQWSKRDLVEVLGVDEEKIVVTPNGVGLGWRAAPVEHVEQLREQLQLPRRYLLAVGVNKPHKNFLFLIETFARWVHWSKEDVSLVICGMQRKDALELSRFAAEQDISGRVEFVPYLEHARLPALYQGAQALVFPSLYEGFGLPVLEAQRLGVPVLASNASCIPEVAGDGALYFDPRSPEELMSRLDELFGEEALREVLVTKGRENERRFSWENSARRTLEVYREKLGI